jgi:ABC-type multidrug transport system fused ATPase/permease subunit
MFRRYLELYRAMGQYERCRLERPAIMRNIWLTLAFMLVGETMLLFQAYPLKLYIDTGLHSNQVLKWTIGVTLAVLVAYGVEEIFDRLADRYRFRALWGNYALINVLGSQHLLALGTTYHTENSSGEKDSMVARNHKKVDVLTDQICFNVVPLCFRIAAILVFSFTADWRAGLLALSSIVLYGVTMLWSQSLSRPHFVKYRAQMKHLEMSEAELSHHAITIDEQGLSREFAGQHAESMDELVASERVAVPKWRHHLGYQMICLALLRATYYPVAFLAWKGGVSVGTLILLSGILERMWSNLNRFQELQRVLREGLPALDELTKLFETEPTVETPENPVLIDKPRGEIDFKQVGYCYGESDVPALSDIDFTIKSGEMVALIGRSGSGKSTLARLAMRLYDPTSGSITFDGVDLRDICPQYLRRELIGYVAQDNVLFDRSIGDNIRLGCIEASDEAIQYAAEMAAIAEFIESLPEGYDTMVGERGIKLSGGQRQRLALARAFVKQPALLVLDEPTSALDAESQDFVKITLRKLAENHAMSVLIIAHRLSTIEPADRIVSMQDGRIELVGTVDEHEALDGIYCDLKRREGL